MRTEMNDSSIKQTKYMNSKIYSCAHCTKVYLSYNALYRHRRQKHIRYNSDSTKNIDFSTNVKKVCSTQTSQEQKKIDESDRNISISLETSTNIKFIELLSSTLNMVYFEKKDCFLPFFKPKLKLEYIHHSPLYKEYEIYKKDEVEYINTADCSTISEKVFCLFLIDCFNKYSDKQTMLKNIFYTILFREFVNKEKEIEFQLSSLFDYTSFNTSEDLIALANEFLNLCLDNKEVRIEDAISFIRGFGAWQKENNFTTLMLLND